MLYMVLTIAFITLFFCFNLLLGLFIKNKQAVNIRLEKIARENSKEGESELNQPIFVRIIRPLLDDISKSVLKITPREFVTDFEKKIIMAGKPLNLSVKDWINIQVFIVICLPLLTAATGYYRNVEVRNMMFIAIIEFGLGLILPSLILSGKVKSRQQKIINSLPDVLDFLTVSVEAGLGFDGALAKVIDKMPGPLAREFELVLQEMKVGKQKRDALKDMAERVGAQDLTIFISSVVQADQLGVSIGNVLRIQSDQLRLKRRQRAQEKAMKAPVKMLIPMVLFIFPTIFSILIGPVIIKMIHTFMK